MSDRTGSTEPDQRPVKPGEARRPEWEEQDREVERITQTVQPGSDAPSRAGITGPGSGADSERLSNKP